MESESETPIDIELDKATSEIIISEHSTSSLQFVLNCFLHISILFFFLVMLFIILISPISQNLFKNELGNIIDETIDHVIPKPIDLDDIPDPILDKLLSTLPLYNSFPYSNTIIKSNLRQIYKSFKSNPYIINNYISKYKSENYLISKHNDDIISFALYISSTLFIISIILCITFKYCYPDSVNLSKLIIENLLTFSLIGAGEYWFFTTFAMKFIPAPPSLLSKSAIDNIKNILLL